MVFTQQNMENDPTQWSEEIKNSLHRFVPLIRFYDIEPTDFFYKIYCYKDILPQDLIHSLLEFHIVPKMKPNLSPSRKQKSKFKLDSILIAYDHIPLITTWIGRKDSSHYKKKFLMISNYCIRCIIS